MRLWRTIRGAFPTTLTALILALAGGSHPPFLFAERDLSTDLDLHSQKVRAPELDGHSGWLNTDEPLTLKGLRGKIVLLDFWTYGCVNCIHIIPDLKRLEAKYSKELVVIGVHSAKFDNEKETENIRRIILRYGIEHPVVNDADFRIWDSYAVRAWPTQVLIDPDGYVVAQVSGEGKFDYFNTAIGELAARFKKLGKLNESPIELALEKAKVGTLPLAFPGKVLADERSKRLFISDSNHNRIVITDLVGNFIETIGSGSASASDGNYQQASFRQPQGLVLNGDHLFVADTGNHLIRKIDLKRKKVETVAGTGTLEGFNGFGGDALKTSLRSPWDVKIAGRYLYIAMAGSHQIWRLSLDRPYIEPFAGTRWESRKDGPVKEAHFAQPSGLAVIDERLFVADSESNIIREIDLDKEAVHTSVGGDLFSFGDRDGEGDYVRLQHPLAVESYGKSVLIADTYNDKIKILDPEKRSVETLLGTGEEGQAEGGSPTFYEPGGLSVAGQKLYIADTNNHAIRVADLRTLEVSTLMIKGLQPPKPGETTDFAPHSNAIVIEREQFRVTKGRGIKVSIDLDLPQGFHLNPSAPNRIEVNIETDDEGSGKRFSPKDLPYKFELPPLEGWEKQLRIRFTAFYCRKDNTGVCYIKSFEWKVPLEVGESSGPEELELKASTEIAR
ncbi:MAG: hypothetical protein DWQ47_00520 [Acidobacteria bacterium]|nr:MAG: hypothetical protein DWQ32_10980 [Acidobacteriota bacterium]REK03993.1 MAG: hypothetical protein DWQ38_00505 [Acidobacteriota bacterium]REK15155.1 MAG: hypothetical protein DWQ43_16670 [Acidobacteriota bacterium]REK46245.1 MAG: hypothetical protein DWQ47_00520 [Acidobacteriota bacterium]